MRQRQQLDRHLAGALVAQLSTQGLERACVGRTREELVAVDQIIQRPSVVDENADTISVQPNPLEPARVEIKKKEIDERTPSKLSPMPANLADVLTVEEILDMIAYMESAGRKQYRSFQK